MLSIYEIAVYAPGVVSPLSLEASPGPGVGVLCASCEFGFGPLRGMQPSFLNPTYPQVPDVSVIAGLSRVDPRGQQTRDAKKSRVSQRAQGSA